MATHGYLRIGRNRLWAERKALTWAALALLSRLAPLSAVPLLLEFSTVGDADHYALILANAAIISIVLNFGQVSNMQAGFSNSGLSSVAIQGLCTASGAAIILSAIGFLLFDDLFAVLINIVFPLSMALTGQYNTLLRCSNKFSEAIYAEILRISLFISATFIASKLGYLNYRMMVVSIIAYYIIPYAIMVSGVRISSDGVKAALRQSWADRSRLFHWTLAAFLSAGAWVSIRYMVALFGGEGDLARFTAVMSFCSAGVIMADLLYVRISRPIVLSIERNSVSALTRLIKITILVAILGLTMMIVLSVSYIYIALDQIENLVTLSILLSVGYSLRFFYLFGQQVMIARGLATYDLAGGVAMIFVASFASWALIPEVGIVGAGVAFILTSTVMLAVIVWGVRRHWRGA